MSTKDRIKFTVAGQHKLLSFVRDHFIRSGLALVPWDEEPHFCLIGAEIGHQDHMPLAQLELQQMQVNDKPVLLLSSSNLYEDTDEPQDENKAVVSCFGSNRAVYALAAEKVFKERDYPCRTMILRPFNVYGPNIHFGVVHEFVNAARKGSMPIVWSGYQRRSFLHEDDFLTAVDSLMTMLLTDSDENEFVFNVGSDVDISIRKLADSAWELTRGPNVATVYHDEEETLRYHHGKLPNIEYLKRETGFKPTISVRTGLSQLIRK